MVTAVVDRLVGRVVDGRYEVLSRIASGGMGTVYLATDHRLGRAVALKVMHEHLAADAGFVARFAREARAAAALSSPAVVAVFDTGDDDGLVYLVLEHVPGTTLRALIDERGALPLRQALDVADQLLTALAAAHAAGLVHRDVTPGNVLVDADGRVRVTDFGLARAVGSSTLVTDAALLGTVAYLAPELLLHGRADARADVYAAGLVVHELLTGRVHGAGEPAQAALRHVREDVPPPSLVRDGLPAAVDDLVAAATRRESHQRPADAGEFLRQLRGMRARLTDADLDAPVRLPSGSPARALTGTGSTVPLPRATSPESTGAVPTHPGPTSDPPPGPGSRTGRRRRRLLVVLLVLVLLAGSVGAWVLSVGPLARVRVPAVVGASQSEASSALGADGLHLRVQRVYDASAPAGHVASADPAPGSAVPHRSTVLLRVSQGPRPVAVPDVRGATRADAVRTLARRHLRVGTTRTTASDAVPAGSVVSQAPSSGSVVPGSAVDLVVSSGPRLVTVPSVVGDSLGDATARLRSDGLRVRVHRLLGLGLFDQVRGQDPAGGRVRPGTTVTLSLI